VQRIRDTLAMALLVEDESENKRVLDQRERVVALKKKLAGPQSPGSCPLLAIAGMLVSKRRLDLRP
jgi:hypothetical protein